MRRKLIAFLFLGVCALLPAQEVLNDESIIKLVKAGLSEELVIATINASPGNYDISANGLISLKTAGVSDKIATAMVSRGSANATASPVQTVSATTANAAPSPASSGPVLRSTDKPRVFLQSQSHGNQWNATRDQSMEMSKDFEQVCPDVRISLNQQVADYTVALNHIEHGFVRDNQIQIANKDGDLISRTKEGGSIKGDVKKACEVILGDWAKK